MTIRQIFSADTGNDLLEVRGSSGTVSLDTTTKRTGTRSYRCNPTTTAVGYYEFGGWQTSGLSAGGVNSDIVGMGFYFRPATLPAANNEVICAILDSTAAVMYEVRISSGGILTIYQGTTLVATGTTVLSVGNWYRIVFICRNTANTQSLILNGVTEASGTATIANNLNNVYIGKRTDRNGQTVDFYYDDGFVASGAAGESDATLGIPTTGWDIRLSVPKEAGATAGWTNGTGSTFAEVDEVPPDDNTTYIQASATQDNLHSTFGMQTIADVGANSNIYAVQCMTRAQTASISGASVIGMRILVNGTGINTSPTIELGTATPDWHAFGRCDAVDPSGSGAWTQTDFDTLEVGMTAGAIAQTQRFTVAYATVMSEKSDAAPQSQAPRTMHQHRMRRAA